MTYIITDHFNKHLLGNTHTVFANKNQLPFKKTYSHLAACIFKMFWLGIHFHLGCNVSKYEGMMSPQGENDKK